MFPALDERADPTWSETMDSLRALRARDQRLWEWRRESPIRPVVFEDPGVVSDEFVHLHLEHRVVRRLLGRFTAQGFVHHDLSRAYLAQSQDAIPRIVLLGRLALFGAGGTRLHEELVPVSARWIDPQDRRGGLTPYRRAAETQTLQLLEAALLHDGRIPEPVSRRLLAAAPRDVHEQRVSRRREQTQQLRLDIDDEAAPRANWSRIPVAGDRMNHGWR